MDFPDPSFGKRRPTDPLPLKPGPSGDRFRILRELGRGGTAVVYLAEDTVVKQKVALKRLLGEPDARRLERIRREVQAGRRLHHPGLVRVHDLVDTPEGPAIVMEAVEGPTLRQVLRERGRLPLHEALAIHREVLTALSALHGANLIHRDIKPENIFLPVEGGVKVGDYSICLPLERTRLTTDGSVMGTMGYMAPEQMDGQDPRPASDLYSAAVVLHEMITGRRPFRGETPTETLYAQLHHAPDLRPLKEIGASRWLRGYIRRCLSRSPFERFVSARRALAAVEAQQGGRAPRAVARRLGAAALAVAAGAGALWSLQGLSHSRVTSITVDGAEAVARDRLGNIHWRHAFHAPPNAFLSEDLDGDGRPEAFAVEAGPYRAGQFIPLTFINARGETTPIREGPAIDHNQGLGGGYWARLMAHDLDGDGSQEVVGYLSSVWYPTQGFVYCVRHHRVTLRFNHPGHIAEMAFADISGDGKKGILFRAMNNVLGHEGVFGAIDGATACSHNSTYVPTLNMPGWRHSGGQREGAIATYAFLPHTGNVYKARTGTFVLADGRWSLTPEGAQFSGDRWGNLDQGPMGGMELAGREAALDYFKRIQRMFAAGLARDHTHAAPEDWSLPPLFRGHQPWDRTFRLVKGRELIRCGAAAEGLAELEGLARDWPRHQEINETCGVQSYLATGDWERGSRLCAESAAEALYRPASGHVAAAKILALAGRLSLNDLVPLEMEFNANCGHLERTRIILAMGLWPEAHRSALAIPQLSPTQYRFGAGCCLAVVEAATAGLTAQTLARARAEADEYPDLAPLRAAAEAIEAARRGGPGGRERAAEILSPVRKAAAWDLDARLALAAYDRATGFLK